jgi:hypothetical protein
MEFFPQALKIKAGTVKEETQALILLSSRDLKNTEVKI